MAPEPTQPAPCPTPGRFPRKCWLEVDVEGPLANPGDLGKLFPMVRYTDLTPKNPFPPSERPPVGQLPELLERIACALANKPHTIYDLLPISKRAKATTKKLLNDLKLYGWVPEEREGTRRSPSGELPIAYSFPREWVYGKKKEE